LTISKSKGLITFSNEFLAKTDEEKEKLFQELAERINKIMMCGGQYRIIPPKRIHIVGVVL